MKRGYLFLTGIFAMILVISLFVYADYNSNKISGYQVLDFPPIPSGETDFIPVPDGETTKKANEEALIIEDITQKTLQENPPLASDSVGTEDSNDYITILFGQEIDSNKILKIATILGGTIILILILIWFLKGRGGKNREKVYIREYAATDSVHDIERILNLGEYYLAIGELDKSKRMYEEIKKLYLNLINQKLSVPEYQYSKILKFYEKLNSALTKLSVGNDIKINSDKDKQTKDL